MSLLLVMQDSERRVLLGLLRGENLVLLLEVEEEEEEEGSWLLLRRV